MLISGPLNDDDVRELAETLRCIERRDPEKHYNIVVTDLDQSRRSASIKISPGRRLAARRDL